MNRINKMFGKKPEHATPLEEGKAGQTSPLAEDVKKAADQEQGQPFFGLKIIFESGEEHTLTPLPVSLGRNDANQIVLKDETVSGNHALIYYDKHAQEVCILDQDSLNGVYIDHCPTRRNILSDGVKISLGAVDMTYRDTGYIHNR